MIQSSQASYPLSFWNCNLLHLFILFSYIYIYPFIFSILSKLHYGRYSSLLVCLTQYNLLRETTPNHTIPSLLGSQSFYNILPFYCFCRTIIIWKYFFVYLFITCLPVKRESLSRRSGTLFLFSISNFLASSRMFHMW